MNYLAIDLPWAGDPIEAVSFEKVASAMAKFISTSPDLHCFEPKRSNEIQRFARFSNSFQPLPMDLDPTAHRMM
jgi:hypothetical protein